MQFAFSAMFILFTRSCFFFFTDIIFRRELVSAVHTPKQRMSLLHIGRWVTTAICGLGAVGNTLSLVVWSALLYTVGGSRFFIALSVSDLLSNIFGMVLTVCLLLGYWWVANLFLYLSEFFFYLSAHTTITIVTQRLLCVAWPFYVRRLCSSCRQVVIIAALVLLTAVATHEFKKCIAGWIDYDATIQVLQKLTIGYATYNFVLCALLTVLNVLLIWKLKYTQV